MCDIMPDVYIVAAYHVLGRERCGLASGDPQNNALTMPLPTAAPAPKPSPPAAD